MNKVIIRDLKSHPNYDAVIDEVVQEIFDEETMSRALRNAKRESQAEALYVLYKLKEQSS